MALDVNRSVELDVACTPSLVVDSYWGEHGVAVEEIHRSAYCIASSGLPQYGRGRPITWSQAGFRTLIVPNLR